MLQFKDLKHKQEFECLLEQADLSEKERQAPSVLLKKQLAFLYLVAMFQADYITYEGEAFYLEAYDELSIGGPTYLLEEQVGTLKAPHELILKVAQQILKGEAINCPKALEELKVYIEEAKQIATLGL